MKAKFIPTTDEITPCQNCHEPTENNDAYCERCAYYLSTGELTMCKGKNCVHLIRTTVYEECDGLCEGCWNDLLLEALWDEQFQMYRDEYGIDSSGA